MCEDINHVLMNSSGSSNEFQSLLQTAKPVTFFDLTPLLPSQNGMSIHQHDLPYFCLARQVQKGIECLTKGFHRICNVTSGTCSCGCNIDLDCLHHGCKQSLLILEMVVKGAATDPRFLQNSFRGRACIAALGEQVACNCNDLCFGGRSFLEFRRQLFDLTDRQSVCIMAPLPTASLIVWRQVDNVNWGDTTMKKCFAGMILAGSLLAFVPLIANGNSADDAKTVAALDTKYQAAVKNGDAATMNRILADDFVVVTGSGKVYTKADLLEMARTHRVQYEHQEDSNQTVRVWHDTAVVTAELWMTGTDQGKPFDFHIWFSDTYVRTPAGWRYVHGQASLPLSDATN